MSMKRALPATGSVRRDRTARPALPLCLAFALVGLSAGACAGGSDAERDGRDGLAGLELPEPRPKAAFTLTDTEGEPFDFREETNGTLTLVFFGYTYCPDICSVTMANLGAALERVPPETRARTRVIFVSTDPERDTGERIREWLDRFHTDLIGLRGDLDRVNAIMGQLGLPPAMREPGAGDGDDYTVGHSGTVVVFTPDDSLRYMYSASTRRLDWIRDLNRLADAEMGPGGELEGG